MDNLTVLTGPAGPYYYFLQQVQDSLGRGQNDFIYILPVNRAVRQFKRKLIEFTSNHVLVDPLIFTFDSFLLSCFKNLQPRMQVLSPEMFQLFIEDIFEKKPEFSYLNLRKNTSAGSIHRISSILSELRRYGYSREKWQKVDPHQFHMPEAKYRDFLTLLEIFEKRISPNFIDEAFAQHRAAELLNEERFRRIWPDIQTIFINGYELLTPAMIESIERMSQWVTIQVKLDYCAENSDLFRQTEPLIETFKKMDANIVQVPATGLSALLFNRQQIKNTIDDKMKPVSLLEADHREREISLIAAKIRYLHHFQKIKPSRIAVTFSNLDQYAHLIRRIFTRFGITHNLSTGYALNQSPLIQHYLSALKLVCDGYPVGEIFRFIISVQNKSDNDNHLIDIYRLILENRIEYLRPGWNDQLLDIIEKAGYIKADDKIILIEAVHEFAKKTEPLFQIKSKSTVKEFRSRFLTTLKSYNLLNWFDVSSSHLSERQQEAEFRAFNRFMKLFEKMLWMLTRMYGQAEIALPRIYQLMRSMIHQSTYSLQEDSDCGVQIMPRLEVLAVDCDVLFVGGLLEGEFPRTSSKDVFFNDDLRAKLGLAAAEEFLNRDRLSFYSLLQVAKLKTILCYPKYDEDRLLIRSTFIDELIDIVPEKIEDLVIPENYLSNHRDLQSALGLCIQSQDQGGAQKNIEALYSAGSCLNNLNDSIKKILISHHRHLFQAPGCYEGNLTANSLISPILTQELEYRSWSATSLDNYAYCPISYLFRRIFKLQDLPDKDESIKSMEKGLAVHQIFYEFYTWLLENNNQHQPSLFRAQLHKIAGKIFSRLPWHGFLAELEIQTYLGSESRQGLLDIFLEDDQNHINNTGFIPAHFELAFGRIKGEAHDKSSIEKPVRLFNENGNLTLVGSIDRVDVHNDGRMLILDYKTGESSTRINVKHFYRGTHFQLPLYALAADKILDNSTVYAGYYLLKSADKCKRVSAVVNGKIFPKGKGQSQATLPNKSIIDTQGDPLSYQQLLSKSLDQAIHHIKRLKQGYFTHSLYPTESQCQNYCDFRRICRKNVGKQGFLHTQQEEERSQ